jgi:hypothetical protein
MRFPEIRDYQEVDSIEKNVKIARTIVGDKGFVLIDTSAIDFYIALNGTSEEVKQDLEYSKNQIKFLEDCLEERRFYMPAEVLQEIADSRFALRAARRYTKHRLKRLKQNSRGGNGREGFFSGVLKDSGSVAKKIIKKVKRLRKTYEGSIENLLDENCCEFLAELKNRMIEKMEVNHSRKLRGDESNWELVHRGNDERILSTGAVLTYLGDVALVTYDSDFVHLYSSLSYEMQRMIDEKSFELPNNRLYIMDLNQRNKGFRVKEDWNFQRKVI